QRVWLVLEEKQLPYQYIEVDPYAKPASLLRLNPRGLVPTLVTPSGRALYESSVVCEYLDDAYPSPRSLLPRDDAYGKARCRLWMDYVGTRIVPAFHRFLQFQPTPDKGLQGVRREFLDTLRGFAGAMLEGDGGKGPWFEGGEEIGMVDLMLAPWVVRLWVFDRYKEGGLGIPAEGEQGDDEVWARWRMWREAVEGRRSVRETGSEREMLEVVYAPYADDTAQSALAKAIREGRAVP
ncbi:MAG: hypothetical protein Q9173_007380, partial [Seirophora scorigena]